MEIGTWFCILACSSHDCVDLLLPWYVAHTFISKLLLTMSQNLLDGT